MSRLHIRRLLRHVCALLIIAAAAAPTAHAQQAPPAIGPFAADVRGAFAHFGQNQGLASIRNLPAADLPGIGLGVSVDGHWYFLKWHAITFGLGAEALLARGHHGATEIGPAVTTRFTTASPQISFNFGNGQGWSYLSGGIGPGRLAMQDTSLPPQPSERVTVINYGAGARWFTTRHLAFTFDIRFYDLQQKPPSPGQLGNPHSSMFVGSVGMGLK